MGSLPGEPSLPAVSPAAAAPLSPTSCGTWQPQPEVVLNSPWSVYLSGDRANTVWPPPTPRAAGSGETDSGMTRTNDGPATTAALQRTAPDSAKMRLSPDGGERWGQSSRSPWHWVACRFLAGRSWMSLSLLSSFTLGNVRRRRWARVTHAVGNGEDPNGLNKLEAWGWCSG